MLPVCSGLAMLTISSFRDVATDTEDGKIINTVKINDEDWLEA